VYIAEATGEIVQKTDRSSRFWGYLGPVMHWFYFTPLRAERGPLWNNLIVWGSVIGCGLCVLGIVIGVYRFSASRRFRRGTSMTPYVGWLQWHHYAGLLFGVFTFTWTFSGLLTMTPFNWFDQGGPTGAQVRAIRGDGVDLAAFDVLPGAALGEFQKRFPPKEVELLQFMGEPFYAAYERAGLSNRAHQDTARYEGGATLSRLLVTATGDTPRVKDGFSQEELTAAATTISGPAACACRRCVPNLTTRSRPGCICTPGMGRSSRVNRAAAAPSGGCIRVCTAWISRACTRRHGSGIR
jgi:hypothetical protein